MQILLICNVGHAQQNLFCTHISKIRSRLFLINLFIFLKNGREKQTLLRMKKNVGSFSYRLQEDVGGAVVQNQKEKQKRMKKIFARG